MIKSAEEIQRMSVAGARRIEWEHVKYAGCNMLQI